MSHAGNRKKRLFDSNWATRVVCFPWTNNNASQSGALRESAVLLLLDEASRGVFFLDSEAEREDLRLPWERISEGRTVLRLLTFIDGSKGRPNRRYGAR